LVGFGVIGASLGVGPRKRFEPSDRRRGLDAHVLEGVGERFQVPPVEIGEAYDVSPPWAIFCTAKELAAERRARERRDAAFSALGLLQKSVSDSDGVDVANALSRKVGRVLGA